MSTLGIKFISQVYILCEIFIKNKYQHEPASVPKSVKINF
ncbi:hypothetical protein FIS3754_41670 [Fischerella sp. NIES-3754]|nr:hypothetical protein FIS3754_41670 [Fischerella sp. NIES-3754]BCX10588.1 MAG: hypothetical protein KatS3mg066_4447 [Fischerella sp.]